MSLFDLIYNSQKNNYYVEELILKFDPLISKYSRKFGDPSDAKSELILSFIKVIKSMSLDKLKFSDDKYLISYINTSIKRAYYDLIQKEYKYRNNNFFTPSNESFNDFISEDDSTVIFNDLLKYLSPKEALIIKKHYLYSCKDTEIAKDLNVSRQNIYIARKRALDKLRKHLVM